ncbi:alpha/beta fold hydrolase [Ruegeria sp. HKCCD6604]|uniref:alpha/beta fold hydrolase n=1 Tax=Ruegeria sp. HKCCD6604 TaxID=2683000 RepID=UPI001491BA19|nr:alpha/beta hydrolase [Ruegeria sp. HKCCD6604]NOC90434.1 alpha/beta fold hydrolase [Ruegeria sp. HKCCD6604]
MTWTTRPRSEIGGLAAIQTGSGPDILLLHGVGLRAEAWGAQLDGLASEARLTAPDMPGHGESPLRFFGTELSEYSDAAQNVLGNLNGPALVVGHSMGAMIALDLATKAPDRICGVVAMNAVFERSAKAALAVQKRAAGLDGETPVDPTSTLRRWFGDIGSPERDACCEWLTAMDPTAYKLAYTVFAQGQILRRDALRKLRCPALFITGSQEPNSTPDMSRKMAEVTPNGRALIIDGAAHMMPMTHASQVNAAISSFQSEVQS